MNGQFAAIAAVLALLGTIVVVAILVLSKRRRTVIENSAALAALQSLNQNYQQRLKYPGPIVYNWEDRVNSKAKLDRYDLYKLFLERLAVLEDQILNQIAVQIKDVSVYAEYRAAYQQLGSTRLGRSTYEQMNREAFARIEQKLFTKRMLSAPVCVAQVRCIGPVHQPEGTEFLRQGTRVELRATAQRARSDETDPEDPVDSDVLSPAGTQPHERQHSIPGPQEGQPPLHELRSDGTDARCQPPCRSHCPREQGWKD